MPVIAKLSKRFYDRFGEDLFNELVEWLNQVEAAYRSDLREINELNFVRFDAKLEQRVTQVEGTIDRLGSRMEQRFAQMEALVQGELRGQQRATIGLIVALWTSLVIPIIGLWTR